MCSSDESCGVAETAGSVFVTVSMYTVKNFFNPVRY